MSICRPTENHSIIPGMHINSHWPPVRTLHCSWWCTTVSSIWSTIDHDHCCFCPTACWINHLIQVHKVEYTYYSHKMQDNDLLFFGNRRKPTWNESFKHVSILQKSFKDGNLSRLETDCKLQSTHLTDMNGHFVSYLYYHFIGLFL